MKELTKRRLIVGGIVAILVSGSPPIEWIGRDGTPDHTLAIVGDGEADDVRATRAVIHTIVRAAVATAAGHGDMEHLLED